MFGATSNNRSKQRRLHTEPTLVVEPVWAVDQATLEKIGRALDRRDTIDTTVASERCWRTDFYHHRHLLLTRVTGCIESWWELHPLNETSLELAVGEVTPARPRRHQALQVDRQVLINFVRQAARLRRGLRQRSVTVHLSATTQLQATTSPVGIALSLQLAPSRAPVPVLEASPLMLEQLGVWLDAITLSLPATASAGDQRSVQ
jgi:hypothetical protein